ncbi:MAG TPA: hypothetical protein VHB21_02090 [Minicystis sp.]|nr:hypothetical protein [Minicystis sp.]
MLVLVLDAQGKPLKLVSVGTNAYGVFAFGVAARGIVAVGAAGAAGVVAIGTNAIGSVFALGVNAAAPVTIALANGVGVVAFVGANGGGAFGGALANAGFSPYAGFVLAALLVALSFVLPRAPRPEQRAHVPLRDLERGEQDAGWVAARVVGRRGGGAIALRVGRRRVELAATPEALAYVGPSNVDAWIAAESRVVGDEEDYRAAPHRERVLRCESLASSPDALVLNDLNCWAMRASALVAVVASALAIGG